MDATEQTKLRRQLIRWSLMYVTAMFFGGLAAAFLIYVLLPFYVGLAIVLVVATSSVLLAFWSIRKMRQLAARQYASRQTESDTPSS